MKTHFPQHRFDWRKRSVCILAALAAFTAVANAEDAEPHGGSSPAPVYLSDLTQVYDGSPKSVTVETDPPNLNVEVTYNGSNTPPTDAGTYHVVATVQDPNYQGQAEDDFFILRAPQSIYFDAIPSHTYGNPPFQLTANADSGLPIIFMVESGPAAIDGDMVTITGTGSVTISAAQAGDNNYEAAESVQQTFDVDAAQTSTSIASSVNPSAYGQEVSFTATIVSEQNRFSQNVRVQLRVASVPGPTGSVRFQIDGQDWGGPEPLDENGNATISTNALSSGNHTVTADYLGDGNYQPSTGYLQDGQEVAANTNSDLAALTISDGALMPDFTPDNLSYTASVPNEITSVTVTPTVAYTGYMRPAGRSRGHGPRAVAPGGATVTVNGVPVASGSASDPITLNVGDNMIDVLVTAEDGFAQTNYTVNVTRGGEPEIAVEQPEGNDLTSGSSSVTFAVAPPNTTGETKTFTIRNTGVSELNGLAVSADGANSGDFSIDTGAMSTGLLPNEYTTFTVTFAPGAIGVRSAMLHISSNDSDENPFDIIVRGASGSGEANALNFDGVDDRVDAQLTSPLFGTHSTTIEFWARGNTTAFAIPINIEGILDGVLWGPTLGFNEFSGSRFDTGYALDKCWHHFAFTYDGATGTLYAFVDGQPTPTPSHSGPWNPTGVTPSLVLGQRPGGTSYPWAGSMDELRIWNVQRSQAQLQANMFTELVGNESGLIYYSKFNQGDAGSDNTGVDVVIDESANASHGTMQGFALNGATSNWVSSGALRQYPEADVQGNGVSIADGDTTPSIADDTEFGSVAIGQTVTRTYTIANTGPVDLTLSSEVTVDGSSDFTVTAQPDSSVGPNGGTTTFTVTFAPTAAGMQTATISFGSDDCDEDPYEFAVGGFGANVPPDITPSDPITRQQGSAADNSVIAMVSDTQTPAGALTVTATTVPDGIAITDVVNSSGTITANIAASCTAMTGDNTIVLEVSDGAATSMANLTVDVTANQPPTVAYDNSAVDFNGSINNSPTTATDNGTIDNFVVQDVGTYTGVISVNASGVVSFSDAAPSGTHTITIRATDNCGASTDALFMLTVNAPPSYTLTYTAGPNGSISGTTPQTVSPGGNGTPVTAVPNAGYDFVNWSDASTVNPRTDTNVTADISVTANFAVHVPPIVTNTNNNGVNSLRQALLEAHSGDTITFSIPTSDPGYTAGVWTINLTSGELLVDKDVTIDGPGADILVVRRDSDAAAFRIFHVTAGMMRPGNTPNLVTPGVTLEGMTITNGNAMGGVGGGIYNEATLTLTKCTVSDNVADFGGGLFNDGTATIDSSTFSGNGTGLDGGGLFNNNAMIVANSTFSGNGARHAGGINNGNGGPATLSVTNSTIFSNDANNDAGGIRNFSGTLTLGNSIVAGNTAGDSGPDINGSITSQGYNLVGDTTSATGLVASDQQNVDPILGPLKNNGGPTLTHAPFSNSPAIDGGKDIDATGQDQRGSLRPVTYNDPSIVPPAGGDRSDIGAVELPPGVQPANAASHKTHGLAGDKAIDLPLTGAPGIECRSGGVTNDYQVILNFAAPVTFTPPAVLSSGSGSVVSITGNGTNQITLNLTDVTNAQIITLALFDANNGANSGDVGLRMGVLAGDTTGNGEVNASDISDTKLQSGQGAMESNFRNDVNANGVINASDVSAVKSKSGTSLPSH